MFHINYETAKAEVARRHERLHSAQRTGLAFEPRSRGQFAFPSRIRSFFARPRTQAEASSTAGASGEPCITC